jgi:hypothetical protein
MDEHFVFPLMGVFARVGPGFQFEDPHAKILGAIGLADHHPACDPFGGIARIRFYFRFLVRNDFHFFGSFLLCFFSNIIKINGEVNFDDFIKSAKMSHCERSEAIFIPFFVSI